jgi:hypothetical protein
MATRAPGSGRLAPPRGVPDVRARRSRAAPYSRRSP